MDVVAQANANEHSGSLKFVIEERTAEYVISRMPVTQDMLNPFGTVHAGAMLWLADVTATVLALGKNELSADGKGFPLAINLTANLLANQKEGVLQAEARFVRQGKRVTIVRTRVTGKEGQLLAEVTTTHIPAH
jgi:1,4-dihydroxy-2-naphthoyl-CoA hydrolase